MVSTTFNAITYANKLKEAGMATKVADVQAEELVNLMNDSVATKSDITQLRNETKSEITQLRNETKSEFTQLRNEMKVMELELKGFIVKGLITAIGVLAIVQGMVFHFIK